MQDSIEWLLIIISQQIIRVLCYQSSCNKPVNRWLEMIDLLTPYCSGH